MDLDELRAFVAVAETGSYLAAADSIGMSRTTLRRKVDALEARAGVALLEGTPRGIILTDAGLALASEGRRMMQEMRAVLSSVRDLGSSPRGILRVTLPVGLPPQVLTQLFGVIRSTFPELYFDTRFSNNPIREPLEDVDLAIHFSEETPGPVWISYKITAVRERLIASPLYLAERGTPESADDLAKHELLVWQAPSRNPRELPLRGGQRLRIQPTLVSTDVHFIRSCALAGNGIGFVPDAFIPEEDPKVAVTGVLEDCVGCDGALRVSAPRALADTPKIRLVLDRVRAFLDTM